MTTDYLPIDCDQHSVLELLAMRRAAVKLLGTDAAGAPLLAEGVVSDVVTRDRSEYLVLQNTAGAPLSVRLDRLQALYDASGNEVWRQKNATS